VWVWGSGFRGLGFRVLGLEFRGWGLGIRVLGFGERRGEIRGKGLEV
jgi:hypothetical protein